MLLYDRDLEKIIKPGDKSLYYGTSGTGKTVVVTLIGKDADKKVFRVDLSMNVSKYVG